MKLHSIAIRAALILMLCSTFLPSCVDSVTSSSEEINYLTIIESEEYNNYRKAQNNASDFVANQYINTDLYFDGVRELEAPFDNSGKPTPALERLAPGAQKYYELTSEVEQSLERLDSKYQYMSLAKNDRDLMRKLHREVYGFHLSEEELLEMINNIKSSSIQQ